MRSIFARPALALIAAVSGWRHGMAVALLSFVGTWNNYFLPLIVLRSQEYQPITVGLASWYQLAQQGGGGGQVLFSIVITGALVSIIPVIVVFLLLQRFWQGGLTAGAIK